MTADVKPQWIARMYAPTTGRDHLGLGSVSSNQILQHLAVGINVLTVHPRYYSFYVFLLDEFWNRTNKNNRTHQRWIEFYRPRAYIYSLATHFCDQHEPDELDKVVGSQKTTGKARETLDEYDTQFNYIKSSLGGYGLYYRTVMDELGIVILDSRLPHKNAIDMPTEKGKEIAAAFREAVEDTQYYRKYFRQNIATIPRGIITEYGRKACLCQLKAQSAPDRRILLGQFLHGISFGFVDNTNAINRHETMRLFLDIADQTDGHEINENTFRQLLYFGEATNGAQYTPRPDIKNTNEQWRLYQLREYYSYALNAMWWYLCEWGLNNRGDIYPVPTAVIWDTLDDWLTFDTLAHKFNLPSPQFTANSPFSDLLEWLQNIVNPDNEFDKSCSLSSRINENKLYEFAAKDRSPDACMAGMSLMLGLTALRFMESPYRKSDNWKLISGMGHDGRRSVEDFMRQLGRKLKESNPTIKDIVQWLLRDYAILQHQIIATSKLPENTFRFRREGNGIIFFPHYNALEFRDSRFSAISTTVHELGLCGNFRKPKHPLTGDGVRLLERGALS
jgi:hypothetical protein